MREPVLVIVSGAPASGKTSLGRRLATTFRLPFLSKDDIKEALFETLGWSDREWSRKLGVATYYLLYQAVEVQLRTGRSCVVESNFRAEHATERFRELRAAYGFQPFQVLCRANRDVLMTRFQDRAAAGMRHPGHVDAVLLAEMEVGLTEDYGLLPIGGASIVIDTTDFAVARFDLAEMTLGALLDQQAGDP